MNRSVEGPARSLLNSFTVATTPPPRVTTASAGAPAVDPPQTSDHLPGRDDAQEGDHVHHHPHHRRSNSGSHSNGGLSPPSAAATSAADPEEEPQPSFIAPQPAPAPPSSADRSSERSATAPMSHGGLVSSSWQPTWRPPERSTEAGSSASGGGGGGGTTARGLSSMWRTAALETPTRPSPRDARGETAQRGGLTPKIRYRSASAGAPRASPAAATSSVGRHNPLPEQSLSRSPQRSLDLNGDWRGTGWGKAVADAPRGVYGGTAPMDSWQLPRGHAAPSLSPAVSAASTQIPPHSLWTADATAAAPAAPAVSGFSRSGAGSGAAAVLHPPPPFTRTRPGLRTQGASEFPAAHSTAPDASGETTFGQQPSAPLASRQVPTLQRGAAASTGSSRPASTARSGPRVSFTDALDPAVVRADAHRGTDDKASLREAACTAEAEADPLSHLTLRSLTEEYNHFSSEGTVGWVGLQVHLRRHTQSTQITALDLTCYRMRREQWLWFTQEILPDLRSLEVLRLVQMGLADEEAAALVRGCCGLGTHVEASRVQQQTSSSERTRTSAATAGAPSPSSTAPPTATASRPTSLQLLRVLDLSGNLITQRSCTHLGKMLLWMADSLEEVRLLGNPLKDYGMQTLGIYIAKLNIESLKEDPELFSGALRHQWRLLQEQQQHRTSASPTEAAAAVKALEAFTIGPVLLDLRDCRASARGLSDLLAAASRAQRLRVVVLSHNVAGVTALLPLPSAAFQEAADVATEATPLAGDASSTAVSGNNKISQARVLRAGPAPRRLRLAKTPLISSGALMRRQQAAFSDVRGFATACAFAILVFHSVPLSQTCSPVGCRELLLNIFFSCPQLELVDLSDTFEWALVPLAEQQRLVAEAVRRDVVEQRLRGPAVQRGLLMYREDQGEVEFVLDTATAAGQTRVGDIVSEFMAHAAHNAVVRQRLVPAAFAHIRELDLSHSGLTDAGVRGLCVSVRRGRARTGMLASLSVLNLSDNLLTVRGCVRVISSFLLEDTADADGDVGGIGPQQPEIAGGAAPSAATGPIAHMTALALQRNAGVLGTAEEGGEAWDGDRIAGYLTDGSTGGEVPPEAVGRGSGSRAPSCSPRESAAYLSEVCTAAETAVLRRATLRSAARSSQDSSGVNNAGSGVGGGAPALTIYFSAPPASALGSGGGSSGSSDVIPNVYYAGCDERSDIFCTCPRSRFYVPKAEADRLARAAAAAPGEQLDAATTTLNAAEQPFLFSSAAFADPAPPPTALSGIGHVVTDAQRTLLSGRDVPRPSAATARSQLQLQRPSLTLSTPDVRLPPRPTFISAVDEANGLVHSGPLLSSMRGGRDPLVSSLLFPPPSTFDSRRTSQLHEEERGEDADKQHQQQQVGQTTTTAVTSPTSRRGSLASAVGASLGSLFMDKSAQGRREEHGAEVAVRQGNVSGQESPAHGAAGTATASSAVAADCEGGEGENLNSSTTRSGKRRAKARQTRTFVLSYDHPAGHLLCRALGVLLRPAPDVFGEGARAALSLDLLTALQRACARAAAYPEGDNSNNEDDGKKSPRAAVVVEAVRYLPPDLTSDSDDDEPHWMRFEVTTNERKARMAQRLQEVLNVSWAAQCVRFANLLQWLRAHVSGGSSGCGEGDRSRDNGAVAGWDPVQAVERAARLSPAVRARLDTRYGGAATTAVHANHFAGGESQPARRSGDTADGGSGASRVMSLAQLHPALWRAVGLASSDLGVGADSTTASKSQGPVAGYRQAKDTDVGEDGGAGEDMYSAISASEDESRASQRDKGEGGVGGGNDAPVPGAAQLPPQDPARLPVVDLYGNSRSPSSKQSQQRGDDGGATTINAARMDHDRSDKEGSPLHSPLRLVESPRGSSPLKAPLEDAEKTTTSPGSPPTPPPAAPADDATPNAAAPRPSATEPRSPTSAAGTASTLFSKFIRRFQAVTDSEEDDEADEKATTSVGTPEKQTRGRERQSKAEMEREPEVKQDEAPPLSSPVLQPAEDREAGERTEGGALLTDQLLGPPSPTRGGDLKPRAADVAPLKQPSSARGEREKTAGEGKGERGGSTGNTESRRGDATRSDSPSSPGSRQRASPVDEAPAKAGEVVEDDSDHAVLSPPVRVQRRPSELEGRVKTFTLSYTHQEGTAVCRAWRLLHSAMGGDTSGQERVSPTSPTSAALAQEARDCLCDDFLALLQPPDEDRKHVVLSVTLHGDGGAATAMLQVQVQTNERRATLANRLQESNHSVRRTTSSAAGRGSIVPLSVEEADRFYFPRLTRLLRRHRLTADTVAQMAPFLAARPALEGRLVKSYGSIGALVHYYHGSATALEHELGIASWGELTGAAAAAPSPAPPPAAAAALSAASLMEVPREAAEGVSSMLSATLVDVSSPTVASDRVLPSHDSGIQGERVSRAASPPESRRVGGGGVKAAATSSRLHPPSLPSQLQPVSVQGRPPPHPRRPPTPPNPITHTSSISFDEITEEPTSEAGPVVVLRGSTPSVSAAGRSPSTPNARNLQYFPVGYSGSTSLPHPSGSGVASGEGGEGQSSGSPERHRRRSDADSDPGALSPLTSAATSPTKVRLSGASPPPHTQLTLEGSKFSTAAQHHSQAARDDAEAAAAASLTPTSPSPQMPPRNLRGNISAPDPPPRLPQMLETPGSTQHDRRGAASSPASNVNLSRQVSGSSTALTMGNGNKSDYERVLEGKYKRLMRVAYDGVARGSVPLEPQHQQKTVIGRGKWGTQKVVLSLEWEILFVLTFEKSRTLGRSSRRAQMVVHPVGIGFECLSGDEVGHQSGETSSLHSSMVNAMTAEGSGAYHPVGPTASQASKGSRGKRDGGKSAASHLLIMIQRPFSPDEVGSSSSEIEATLLAGALLTVSSATTLSKAAWLLGGGGGGSNSSNVGEEVSNTSRGSAVANQVAQDMVFQLCQRSLTLDIEMKSSKHVQEALRLLKNSIRRATQAVRKSMSNAHLPPPSAPT